MEDPFREDENEAARKAQEELARQRYEEIMATKDGRWVLWSILESMGRSSPVFGARDAGAHAAAIVLADKLRACNIELYHQMIVENDR